MRKSFAEELLEELIEAKTNDINIEEILALIEGML